MLGEDAELVACLCVIADQFLRGLETTMPSARQR